MTTHLIESLNVPSALAPSTKLEDDCPFCAIVAGKAPAWKVYEDDNVMAFLDILPARRGHLLLVPKLHVARLSELPEEIGAHLGRAVVKLSNALVKALDNTRLNVVCNQEYAQAVFHVHYHIIPAPTFTEPADSPSSSPKREKKRGYSNNLPETNEYNAMLNAEYRLRDELDEEDAEALVGLIRAKL